MQLERVSLSNKVRALVILWLFLSAAYLGYIFLMGKSSAFELSILKSELMLIKPAFLIAEIRSPEGNQLLAAALIKGINLVVFVAAGFIVGILLFRRNSNNKKEVDTSKPSDDLLRPEASTSRIMVIPHRGSDEETATPKVDPFNESFFRLTRAPVNGSPKNAYQGLELAIMSILKAYPTVPASPDGFHGITSLLSHSIAVAKKAKEIAADKGVKDPLLVSLALAHDIDKIIAYTKQGDTWVRKATHYQQMGPAIVRSLPEYSKLHEADRICICRVLRYNHHPDKIPLNATDRQKQLIDIIRKADHSITRRERGVGPTSLDHSSTLVHDLQDSIISALGRLNINQSIESGPADGWSMTALPFVAVPEENLRNKIKEMAGADLHKYLQLGVPFKSEGHHPASSHIVKAASDLGLLQYQHNKVESKGGLFVIRNGSIQFKGVMLIDKKKIDEVHPGLTDKWGSSKYRITIQKPYELSVSSSNQEDN